jgi:DNA mismatch repair protein MutS2
MAKMAAKMKTLDLHGYKLDEVEAPLDRLLVEASNQNLNRVRVLTGKGTGAVKAAVIKYLKLANYQWEYEKLDNGSRNEGALIVFIS